MCVIVYKPADVELDSSVIAKCWNANPHGAGYCYPQPARRLVAVRKGFMRLKALKKALFADLKAHADRPFIVHFRIATQGAVNQDNCHPHSVTPGCAIAHNGNFALQSSDKDDDRSDTRLFVDSVLAALPKAWWRQWALKFLVEEYCGSDRLALMDSSGEVVLLNEESGEWIDGVWYSNTYWDRTGSLWYGQRHMQPGGSIDYNSDKESAFAKCSLCKTPLTMRQAYVLKQKRCDACTDWAASSDGWCEWCGNLLPPNTDWPVCVGCEADFRRSLPEHEQDVVDMQSNDLTDRGNWS